MIEESLQVFRHNIVEKGLRFIGVNVAENLVENIRGNVGKIDSNRVGRVFQSLPSVCEPLTASSALEQAFKERGIVGR